MSNEEGAMNMELTGRGYFFTYQFVNKLSRAFMVRHRFGQEVIYGHIGQPQKAHFPLAKPATSVRTKRNFIVGNKIIKRPCFFFGHSCHCHPQSKYTTLRVACRVEWMGRATYRNGE